MASLEVLPDGPVSLTRSFVAVGSDRGRLAVAELMAGNGPAVSTLSHGSSQMVMVMDGV